MGAASDVPEICDLILNGERYMLDITQDQRAAYSYVPPFIDRTNTGDQTDDKQDFWLTWAQTDWSRGEEVQFQTRGNDPQNTYWRGKNVDLSYPGEVRTNYRKQDLTFAANPKTAIGDVKDNTAYFATSTTLYHVDSAATITSDGAHGLGAAPSRWGLAWDGNNIFISTTTAGTVGVRKWFGAAFTTFSGTGADSLAYLNNTLYGYSETSTALIRYDAAGVATTIFTWKDSAGGGLSGIKTKLVPFGGKLIIFRPRNSGASGAEIWIYDGNVAPTKLQEFPANFDAYDCISVQGTLFISGITEELTTARETIWFQKDGNAGILWKSTDKGSSKHPTMVPFYNGICFLDSFGFTDAGNVPRLVYYDSETGAFSTLIELTGLSSDLPALVAAQTFMLIVPSTFSGTTGYLWPGTLLNTVTEVDSSRIDFNTSLPKILRGVTAYFSPGGGSGTVDISTSVDGGAYTSLQTGATSGTEYKLAQVEGTTHGFVQIRATLNTGSGNGGKLYRISLRGVPVKKTGSVPSSAQRIYRLALFGKDGEGHVEFYNSEHNPKDGKQMHTDLQTAQTKTAPFSITDAMGTYTGIIQDMKVYQVRKDEFVAEVTTREV